jgi:hypothetical protein
MPPYKRWGSVAELTWHLQGSTPYGRRFSHKIYRPSPTKDITWKDPPLIRGSLIREYPVTPEGDPVLYEKHVIHIPNPIPIENDPHSDGRPEARWLSISGLRSVSLSRLRCTSHELPGVQGAGRHNWVKKNFGASWERVDTPHSTLGYWTHIKMHPFQPDWMLALVRRHECSLEASALDKWCASDLFVTQVPPPHPTPVLCSPQKS